MSTTPGSPKPSNHHGYEVWSVSWYTEGKRHWKRFGKCSEVSKSEAYALYHRWINEEFSHKPAVQDGSAGRAYLIADLCKDYSEVCRKKYVRKDGTLSTHISQVESSLNAMIRAFGDLPVDAVGSPELTKIVEAMPKHKMRRMGGPLLTYGTVNARLKIIKQMYRWARARGLVDRNTAVDISLTEPLKKNSGLADKPRDVKPVSEMILDFTLAHCPPTVKDMINLQLVTGMRSGEMVQMRPCDIDVSDKTCWVYVPRTHKTERHGKDRNIYIGARGQEILQPYLNKRGLTDSIFLPADAHRERLEMNGKPNVMAYQMSRSRFKPGRAYDKDTYRNAVQRACDRAFDADGMKRAKRNYSHRWWPHQLRHNFATMVRMEAGVEAASALLGHSSLSTTEIYAEKSAKLGKDTIRRVG